MKQIVNIFKKQKQFFEASKGKWELSKQQYNSTYSVKVPR